MLPGSKQRREVVPPLGVSIQYQDTQRLHEKKITGAVGLGAMGEAAKNGTAAQSWLGGRSPHGLPKVGALLPPFFFHLPPVG